MNNFAIFGLGQFGFSIAECLMESSCEVLAIDRNPEKIEEIKDIVTMAVIGNVADRGTFDKFITENIECIIIGLGQNLEDSVLATLYAKETGIKNIIAKASTEDHGKILEHIGATEVVYPSKETAKRLATGLTNPNLLDYLPIYEGYSLIEINLPDDFLDKSLRELDLQKKYGIMVIAIKEAHTVADGKTDSLSLFPSPDMKLARSMRLVVVGRDKDIANLKL